MFALETWSLRRLKNLKLKEYTRAKHQFGCDKILEFEQKIFSSSFNLNVAPKFTRV